jgi:hypothetical protein
MSKQKFIKSSGPFGCETDKIIKTIYNIMIEFMPKFRDVIPNIIIPYLGIGFQNYGIMLEYNLHKFNFVRNVGVYHLKIIQSKFHNQNFGSSRFYQCKFDNVVFIDCEFSMVNFINCTFDNVKFIDCEFVHGSFMNMNFGGIKFKDCTMSNNTISSSCNGIGLLHTNNNTITFENGDSNLDMWSEEIEISFNDYLYLNVQHYHDTEQYKIIDSINQNN